MGDEVREYVEQLDHVIKVNDALMRALRSRVDVGFFKGKSVCLHELKGAKGFSDLLAKTWVDELERARLV